MRLRQLGLAALGLLATTGATSAKHVSAANETLRPSLASPQTAAPMQPAGVSWSVSARPQPDKPLKQLCILAFTEGPGKMTVALRNSPAPNVKPEDVGQGSAYFVVTLPDKIGPDDKATLTAALGIPGQQSWGEKDAQWAPGKAGGGSIAQFVDKDVNAVIPALTRGSAFEATVKLPDGSSKDYSMSLQGSTTAVNAFKLCLGQI